MDIKLEQLSTETRNPKTMQIDTLEIKEMLRIINNEDKEVPYVVEQEIEKIAAVISIAAECLRKGGRLIYFGAGTSGRLGVLDAVECRPTYGVDDEVVQGVIAGGQDAMFRAQEGAEDNEELAIEDLKKIGLKKEDILIGIAASGRTPYVIAAIKYAKAFGAATAAIACNKNSEIGKLTDLAIELVVGPEVITGSTRMKAGTAQKLVLNMISTGVMVQLGKVYSNLMVDVKASNLKLIERAKRIVVEATGCEKEEAVQLLEESNYDVKLTILRIKLGIDEEEAKETLKKYEGHISKIIKNR